MANYIDKEKAKKVLNDDYAYAASKLLDEVPVEDVAEVKHGKWLKKLEHGVLKSEKIVVWESKKCSECGYNHTHRTSYCPNCGAKMDKERDLK